MKTAKSNFKSLTFAELSAREWLLTNGLGGYASSSLSGANTRRYHGLLVAALNPPAGRMVMVSKIEETIVTPENELIKQADQHWNNIIEP